MTSRDSHLVPPAIARKLDQTIPGADEALRDLEAIRLPRFQVGFPPQRLTMTLLGEFWGHRTEAIPSAALVRLLEAFEITEQAARVALGRLAARGALIMERRGRTTWYRQSPNLLTILPQGRAVTAGFGEPRTGWDGTWAVVVWSMSGGSPAVAHRVRMNLSELGFAPLSPGVWVSPDHPGEQLVRALTVDGDIKYTVFSATDADFPGAVSPRSTWDPAEILPHYDNFLDLFGAVQSNSPAAPLNALVTRTRAVYRWFVIATLDPDLPAELLPPDWPRTEARRLLVDVVDQLAPLADRYVRSVIGEFAPELADLVTFPLPYGPTPDVRPVPM
jgi:phenylacetic acid degradation operon negative regulatory protein